MSAVLAIDGGRPVRTHLLPYGRQDISDKDVAAVAEVLRGDWLTTGPTVGRFETAFARTVGAAHAVAVSNGTAALHASMRAADVGPGDEVIVPTLTFAASANAALYEGATVVFADIDPNTLLIDVESVRARITSRTRAIVAVDYAGLPCDHAALRALADAHGLRLIDDACHALGATENGRPSGMAADLRTYSFHPVKHLATGEGGMIATDDAALASRLRIFRNHGIVTDHAQRASTGAHAYEMVELGYNYRLTDIQCALGLSQLDRLGEFVRRRQEIAARYAAAFAGVSGLTPQSGRPGAASSHHLYVVRLDLAALRVDRDQVYQALRSEGIGVNVHYPPVHLHPYYRQNFGHKEGECPVAEAAYPTLLSLPMFPAMTDDDIRDVTEGVTKVLSAYGA